MSIDDTTDVEWARRGWRWALRDAEGKLLALTTSPEDVGEWDRRYSQAVRIVPLRHLLEKSETEGNDDADNHD